MKRVILSLGGAALVVLVLAGGVAAAGPRATTAGEQAGARDVVPSILGLTQAQVMDLRHDGLSLAQIAARQKVDPQKLVDALKTRWAERIEARVANGGITADAATKLKAQLDTQARNQVFKTALGGMRGAAVGAGPMGSGRGAAGAGTCDGTGPRGAGRP
jgi:hypothetical protein